jgi:hypothetical protein
MRRAQQPMGTDIVALRGKPSTGRLIRQFQR